MTEINPYHQGELEVQKLAGVQAIASRVSRLIQNSLPIKALDYIRQQPMIWIGIEDENRDLWAFPLFGPPGFIQSERGEQIEINLKSNFCIPDQWHRNFKPGKFIGCLVIDLAARIRLRINGIIEKISDKKIWVNVQQAYENCPKYIRKRTIKEQSEYCTFQFISAGGTLTEQLIDMMNQSDTAFVASRGPDGADVSHRGGMRGFIRYHLPNKILIPDYKGNSMFNTLGNFMENPLGGLTIADFNQGYFLQLSGTVKILFDNNYSQIDTGGTSRFWELEIHQWKLFRLQSSFKWESHDFSPFNP